MSKLIWILRSENRKTALNWLTATAIMLVRLIDSELLLAMHTIRPGTA
jgi:hypothetical protein